MQSEFGGEFRTFTNFINDLGIIHRLTCSHRSHQDGNVERKHRNIIEMGLALLAHASLTLMYWDHSFTEVVYLINRLPIYTLNKLISPYHALFKCILVALVVLNNRKRNQILTVLKK